MGTGSTLLPSLLFHKQLLSHSFDSRGGGLHYGVLNQLFTGVIKTWLNKLSVVNYLWKYSIKLVYAQGPVNIKDISHLSICLSVYLFICFPKIDSIFEIMYQIH